MARACSFVRRFLSPILFVVCIVSGQAWGTTLPGGAISVPTTWDPSGNPWVIQGTVTIQSGATLTIQPGTVVVIDTGTNPNARIEVGSAANGPGTLRAVGISASHVRFTRSTSTGGVGIDFTPQTGSGSRLEFCELGTSGPGVPLACTSVGASFLTVLNSSLWNCVGIALDLQDSSPTLQGVTFQANGGPDISCAGASAPSLNACVFSSTGHEGLSVSGSLVPQLSACAFNGTGTYALRVPPGSIRSGAFTIGSSYSVGVFVNPVPNSGSGPITSTTTWPVLPSGKAYELAANLYIEGGAVLTLPAGTQIRGSNACTIYCGDPSNPANGGSLSVLGSESQHVVLTSVGGTWGGVQVTAGPSGLDMQYAELRGGGRLSISGPHTAPNDVTLQECILRDSPTYAVIASSGARLVITGSSITNNVIGGVTADNTCDVTAVGNWWGDPSGPFDPSSGPPDLNPGGLGQAVTDFVSYRPFLTQPPCLSPRTITATAGPHGSVAPAGAATVACGNSASYTVTPAAGFEVADVLVDGASVGPQTAWTFPASNVQANHTIHATFAELSVVNAVPPARCVTDPDSCVGVEVQYAYGGTVPVRLFSVTLALGGTLELCGGVAGVHEGTYLSSVGATQMFVVDLGGGRYTVDCTILGLPCGATGPGTLFTLDVTSSAATGLGTVTIESVTVRDCANGDIAAAIGSTAEVGIDNLPLTGVTDLAATQVKTGNGATGLTGIALTFSAPANATTVEVYRAPFGAYPEYDDAGGAPPSVPTYPPVAPWVLTGVTTTGELDAPPSRDFWYHVVFFKDACGQVSAASNMTTGSLDYHLGDVSDGVTPGTGNNMVDSVDLSALGAHYGAVASPGSGFEYLDVGPTTDHSVDARPTTDDQVNFEDLAMFAIDFGQVSAPQSRVRPAPSSGAPEQVAVTAPGEVTAGQTFDAAVQLSGSGRLQMLSVALGWDAAVVEPLGSTTGAWLEAQRGIALSPSAGVVDAALLGVRSPGLSGVGELASVRFRALAAGHPAVRVAAVEGRDATNATVPVEVATLAAPGGTTAPPSRTALAPIAPTPSRGAADVGFSLARGGRVTVTVLGVDGRRVRTLVDDVREPGVYHMHWDGSDAAGSLAAPGLYYVRLEAPGARFTRRLVLMR